MRVQYLSEIDRNNAVPFAIKPITLEFMINKYKKDGQIHEDRTELYYDGCLKLCEDIKSRPPNARKLSPKQRRAVATRIAAITIFSKRYAIWTEIDLGNVHDEDVEISRLSGGKESIDADRFDVTEGALKETLDTGLFSSRGPNRMGWAHQTYAEFLAAHYIKIHNMPLPQVISLITHPGDPEGKLVPQLHGTSAWLATMRNDVFQHIMGIDPLVLLRSDLGGVDDEYKENIVEKLLALYDEDKLSYPDWRDMALYVNLSHPRLADQIREYICDNEKSIESREVAIRIASACNEQVLQDDLVEIALDPSQPLEAREEAAGAISIIGDGTVKKRLKPLTSLEGEEDPNDHLKGYALKALWPDNLTAEELFSIITSLKHENYFLHNVADHIEPCDIPTALTWVETNYSSIYFRVSFSILSDDIILKAWRNLEYPGVLESFVKVIISRSKYYGNVVLHRHDSKFRDALNEDEDKRHSLLEAIVTLTPDLDEKIIYIIFNSDTPIASGKDVYWMIERLKSPQEYESEKIQHHWAALIEYAFDRRDTEQLNSILTACEENNILADKFAWLIEPIELDSPKAKKMRERYLETKELLKKRNNRPQLDPPPAERIALLIDEFESGNTSAWWRLNMEMTLKPDSTHYGNEYESDLTSFPGWDEADVTTRLRIIAAAKRYLREGNPETERWLGTSGLLYRPAFAGYRAFRLILQEEPEFISTVPASVWEKWAPIILAHPSSFGVEDSTVQKELVKNAYLHAPDEIIKTLIILTDEQNIRYDKIYIMYVLEGIGDYWDEKLAESLLNKAKDESLKPECMGDLLSLLLDHNVEGAKAFSKSILRSYQKFRQYKFASFNFLETQIFQCFSELWDSILYENKKMRSRAVIAASVLMSHADDAGWSVVWPAIEKDIVFGQDVIFGIETTSGIRSIRTMKRFKEDELASLYIWVFRQYNQFQHKENTENVHAHFVTPGESIFSWSYSILNHLKERGTPEAVEAIKRISQELPEQDWLKWTIMEAQYVARRETWTPPKPDYILRMARDQQKRLVESGDELLNILIESLKQLEKLLQDETPASRDIWDRVEKKPNKKYRPIDEEEFSDYVARYLNETLRQRGVVIGREVRIHRGDRTDIHVDAIKYGPSGGTYDSVAVIIEVKGCWNDELSESMRTQLLDRYLRDNRCQHGLYLVGWFNCDLWDDNDNKRKIARKLDLTIDEARQKFEDQAAELSDQNTRIRAFVMNTALR